MAKRRSLLANFQEEGQGASQQSAEVVTLQEQPKAVKAKVVQNTIYLPPQVHRQLKEMAFAMDCKIHDLFIQGIDHVLASKGYPSVSEMAKK